MKESSRQALILIQNFKERLILKVSSIDFEVNSIFPLAHFYEMYLSMEGIEEYGYGITNTPEHGIVLGINDI